MKIKPYYEESGVVIYHGDCRKILPHLPKVDLICTDPPYGVDYDGGTTKRDLLLGDSSASLYAEVVPLLYSKCNHDAAMYMFYADSKSIEVRSTILSAGFQIRNTLIWNKHMAQYGSLTAQYKQKYEPFLYCHLKGKSPHWYGPTNETTVWDVQRASANKYHPTQKPVELFCHILQNSSVGDHLVLDPFMGSGTTLVASKQLGRRAIGIEIEEKYCVVAADRLRRTSRSLVVETKKYKPKSLL